jgi:hypothetical protein
MSEVTTKQITNLLSMAGSAHHIFEQTVLQGVYDQDWPAWYANYIIESGLNDLLSQRLTVEQLGPFLYDINERYKAEKSALSWANYTAGKITENWAKGSYATVTRSNIAKLS